MPDFETASQTKDYFQDELFSACPEIVSISPRATVENIGFIVIGVNSTPQNPIPDKLPAVDAQGIVSGTVYIDVYVENVEEPAFEEKVMKLNYSITNHFGQQFVCILPGDRDDNNLNGPERSYVLENILPEYKGEPVSGVFIVDDEEQLSANLAAAADNFDEGGRAETALQYVKEEGYLDSETDCNDPKILDWPELNEMSREELLCLIAKIRGDLAYCEDADGFCESWAKQLKVDASAE